MMRVKLPGLDSSDGLVGGSSIENMPRSKLLSQSQPLIRAQRRSGARHVFGWGASGIFVSGVGHLSAPTRVWYGDCVTKTMWR